NVEECILATQEKIIENEHRLNRLQSVQNEINEEINNDLKRIQEQIYEASNLSINVGSYFKCQTRTTEQLDYMLQAIHEYARLIEEASLTIKHFGDVGSPMKYESLDLSPFRQHEGSISYFDDHIHHSARSSSSESQESPGASPSTTHTAATTPTSLVTDPELSPAERPPQMIYPLPRYQLKHQKLLLSSMRRAAVGLKFLLYANQLNDYKNDFPDSDCDLDLGSFDNPLTEEVVTTTYRDVSRDREGNDIDSKTNTACSRSDSGCDSNNSDSGGSDSEKNRDNNPGNICVTIRKRSHVVHSYDLLRFEKRTVGRTTGILSNMQLPIARGRIGHCGIVSEKNT
ncbi:1872_t:CDS:2, partial [Acaulospora colombiana]